MTKVGYLVLMLTVMYLLALGQPREVPMVSNLVARLNAIDLVECWDALAELRSCTAEIILFFLNGQTYLGTDCCQAIRIITHKCWPSMLTSLGFTAEEGDILRGYCDAPPPVHFSYTTPPPLPAPCVPTPAPLVAAQVPSHGLAPSFYGMVISEELVP